MVACRQHKAVKIYKKNINCIGLATAFVDFFVPCLNRPSLLSFCNAHLSFYEHIHYLIKYQRELRRVIEKLS